MYRIRAISRRILAEKIAEDAAIGGDDRASKKDIMSLLVRARAAGEKGPAAMNGEYKLTDEAMVDQMVRGVSLVFRFPAIFVSWEIFVSLDDICFLGGPALVWGRGGASEGLIYRVEFALGTSLPCLGTPPPVFPRP